VAQPLCSRSLHPTTPAPSCCTSFNALPSHPLQGKDLITTALSYYGGFLPQHHTNCQTPMAPRQRRTRNLSIPFLALPPTMSTSPITATTTHEIMSPQRRVHPLLLPLYSHALQCLHVRTLNMDDFQIVAAAARSTGIFIESTTSSTTILARPLQVSCLLTRLTPLRYPSPMHAKCLSSSTSPTTHEGRLRFSYAGEVPIFRSLSMRVR